MLDKIFLFQSVEDTSVMFSPIWSLLSVQTHTLHILAKYHILHVIETLPASEPETSHDLALPCNSFE